MRPLLKSFLKVPKQFSSAFPQTIRFLYSAMLKLYHTVAKLFYCLDQLAIKMALKPPPLAPLLRFLPPRPSATPAYRQAGLLK
ncbi:MAG: hypothetical protein A2X59_09885 [Nitrospirae bacterium GWC2_42_7]|nr:MAG: hypothetical protein A2X59_09885 [Nitrospirae bacterium GWC2_42_7]